MNENKNLENKVKEEVEDLFQYFKNCEIRDGRTGSYTIVFSRVENYTGQRCAETLYNGQIEYATFWAQCNNYAHEKFMETIIE